MSQSIKTINHLSTYTHATMEPQNTWGKKRTELCGETDNSAMTAGAFNTAEQQREKSITDLINIEHTTQKKVRYF